MRCSPPKQDYLDLTFSQELRIALEKSPIGKLVLDSKGKILFANKCIERIFLYNEKEFLGENWKFFFPMNHSALELGMKKPDSWNLKSASAETGRELSGIRKDGKEIPVEVQLIPFTSSRGDFILVAIVDISEKKLLEGAVRSNKELEQFAYVASHDLQAPLRHISSYIEALAKKNEGQHDEESKKWVDRILQATHKMSSLIQDLLKYARISHNTPAFERKNITTLLNEVVEVLKIPIEASQAEIVYDCNEEVVCAPRLLEEVFQNFFENAIKFKKPDLPPKIAVSLKSNETHWIFKVEDNGIGIDPKYVERIFIPFQRLNNRNQKPGNGIGLAVVRKIAETHGGRVWVENKPEGGSAFFFTISKKITHKSEGER